MSRTVLCRFEGNDELCGKPTGRTCKSVRSLLEGSEPAGTRSLLPRNGEMYAHMDTPLYECSNLVV